MTPFLTLARDYIERMANPVYGALVNEEYSLRFARILESEGFEQQLAREVADLDDRETLTSHGWLWLIGWAKANQMRLPDRLLVELFDEWASVFVKAEIVDLATQDSELSMTTGNRPDIREFPHSFLARILDHATRTPTNERTRTDRWEEDSWEMERRARERLEREGERRTRGEGRAEGVPVALLQVEREITLNAASVLLHHRWEGQGRLLEYFWSILELMEPETRALWIARLRPPPAPNGERGER